MPHLLASPELRQVGDSESDDESSMSGDGDGFALDERDSADASRVTDERLTLLSELASLPNGEHLARCLVAIVKAKERYVELSEGILQQEERARYAVTEMAALTRSFPDGGRALGEHLWLSFWEVVRSDWITQLFGVQPSEFWEKSAQRTVEALEARRANIETLRSMPYRDYLGSDHWQATRDRALSSAESRCQLCNSRNALEVHHRTYERRGDEPLSDLIVLCADCHGRFHDKLPKASRWRDGE